MMVRLNCIKAKTAVAQGLIGIKSYFTKHFSKLLGIMLVFFITAVCRYLSVELEKVQALFTPDYGFFETTTVNMYKHREVIRYVFVCASLFSAFMLLTYLKNHWCCKSRTFGKLISCLLLSGIGVTGIWVYNSHSTGGYFWCFTIGTVVMFSACWFMFYRRIE